MTRSCPAIRRASSVSGSGGLVMTMIVASPAARDDFRHDIGDDSRIGAEQPQPPLGIVAVHRAAGHFVDADGHQDEFGAGEIRIAAGDQAHRRAERRAVLHVGHHAAHPRLIGVEHDDFVRGAAAEDGHDAGGADGAGPDDPDFHVYSALMATGDYPVEIVSCHEKLSFGPEIRGLLPRVFRTLHLCSFQ